MSSQINIWIVLVIIFVHWFADFVMQTDEQAKNKSKSLNALLEHTFTYTLIWFIPISFTYLYAPHMFGYNMLWFLPITFICHTLTDYFTSKLNTYLWEKKDVHNFFVSVGFDQVLHYLQLFLTYQYLVTY